MKTTLNVKVLSTCIQLHIAQCFTEHRAVHSKSDIPCANWNYNKLHFNLQEILEAVKALQLKALEPPGSLYAQVQRDKLNYYRQEKPAGFKNLDSTC